MSALCGFALASALRKFTSSEWAFNWTMYAFIFIILHPSAGGGSFVSYVSWGMPLISSITCIVSSLTLQSEQNVRGGGTDKTAVKLLYVNVG